MDVLGLLGQSTSKYARCWAAGEQYRFFVVLRRPDGAPAAADFVPAMDCEGRDAGGGGIAGDCVQRPWWIVYRDAKVH